MLSMLIEIVVVGLFTLGLVATLVPKVIVVVVVLVIAQRFTKSLIAAVHMGFGRAQRVGCFGACPFFTPSHHNLVDKISGTYSQPLPIIVVVDPVKVGVV